VKRLHLRILISLVIVTAAGLWIHARSYDFFADDAFITLRYGRMLWEHGEPVYNLGQRVEGYTSPLWMVFAAIAHGLGDPVRVMQGFGGVGAVLWLIGLARLWWQLEPQASQGAALVLVGTALSCPIAAWTMGGLETPLFGALLTWSIAEAAHLASRAPSLRHALVTAMLLTLTTLARPKVPSSPPSVITLLLVLRFDRPHLRQTAVVGGVYALLTGTHVLWRYGYYGYWLPNTYYLKSSGESAALMKRGWAYVVLAGQELGWPLVFLFALGLLLPWLHTYPKEHPHIHAKRLILWSSFALWLCFVPYIIRIGGDFLDLYRFFAPLLPLGFVLVAAAMHTTAAKLRLPWQALLALTTVLLGLHGFNQWKLKERAQSITEPARIAHGIEALGWTRLYALRWAAMGRWVASFAKPDDWMAVGAAGAMPYFAGISNLDTFGLCDEFVAHHGAIVASRPGHQRFAPFDYMMRRRPTFVFVDDYSRDYPLRHLSTLAHYRREGYQLVEAHLTPAMHTAPSEFFHYLYVRQDRAKQMEGQPAFRR